MDTSIASSPVRCAGQWVFEWHGPIVPRAMLQSSKHGGASSTSLGFHQWKRAAVDHFKSQWGDRPPIDKPVEVAIVLGGKHGRGGDPSNTAGSILRAMVGAGVLRSDNLVAVPKLSIELQHNPNTPPIASIKIIEITP